MKSSTLSFRMDVVELFYFKDGRSVFVGPIEGHAGMIHSFTCELLVDGLKKQLVRIRGEMIPDTPHKEGYRVVWTNDKVDIGPEDVKKYRCALAMADGD